jgi:hypothetical protein
MTRPPKMTADSAKELLPEKALGMNRTLRETKKLLIEHQGIIVPST